MEDRLTITEIAKTLGVTPRTIMRWEKAGKIGKPKRDWRGWRVYKQEDLETIKEFYESIYEYDEYDKSIITTAKSILIVALAITGILATSIVGDLHAEPAGAPTNTTGIRETAKTVDIVLEELPTVTPQGQLYEGPMTEPVNYTLGPNDVVSIEVRRHPEFSGQYTVNSEGKIEYKYIGDIIVAGLNKTELKERLDQILGEFIIQPEINVQIVAYLSKVFYVVGEVGRPGKFYMRGDTITVREALMQASLPTYSAAMRRCRLITPDEKGKDNYVDVNVYSLLYEGNLEENLTMEPGDVLYVPATALAKMFRVISPATNALGSARGTTGDVQYLGGI